VDRTIVQGDRQTQKQQQVHVHHQQTADTQKAMAKQLLDDSLSRCGPVTVRRRLDIDWFLGTIVHDPRGQSVNQEYEDPRSGKRHSRQDVGYPVSRVESDDEVVTGYEEIFDRVERRCPESQRLRSLLD
jgi:hypothetical protein